MKFATISTLALMLVSSWSGLAQAQTPNQPKIAPGPNEPDWSVVLKSRYGLEMFADLANPVETTPEAVAGLFVKAGEGPVTYAPVIALGLETTNRGGWYRVGDGPAHPLKVNSWVYTFKNTTADLENDRNLPPPLQAGSRTQFDPGDAPFGVWVSNDGLNDGGVFSEPAVVKAVNARLAKQPYKAMIYPLKEVKTGKVVPNAYLIGWEYSTNDDFQDVVCEIRNVRLVK